MGKANNTQASYFYSRRCLEEYDGELILDLQQSTKSVFGCVPLSNTKFMDAVLANGRDRVNHLFGEDFNLDEILNRFYMLEERYDCFKIILMHANVVWDKSKNTISCDPATRDYFVAWNKLAKVYKENMEFAWDELQSIFGRVTEVAMVVDDKPIRSNDDIICGTRKPKQTQKEEVKMRQASCDPGSDIHGKKTVNVNVPSDSKILGINNDGEEYSSYASCSSCSWSFKDPYVCSPYNHRG